MLRSVGPKNMHEDELVIGRNYKPGWGVIFALAPLVAAQYADTKWVLAIGFAIALPLLNEANGRLYDMCIRLRRTNILINGKPAEAEFRAFSD